MGLAVDEDGAGGGVVEAGDEGDEGGFAGAGGADDGEGGAGGDVEVDVVEDLGAAGGVGEGEVAEVDVAGEVGGGGQLPRAVARCAGTDRGLSAALRLRIEMTVSGGCEDGGSSMIRVAA